MSPLPVRKPLAKAERSLERVEKLIELFEPFILHNEHDFVADNVEKLAQALARRSGLRLDTTRRQWIGGNIGSRFISRRCGGGLIH